MLPQDCRGYLWGTVLALVAIFLEQGCALVEPDNLCLDAVTTNVLFDAGAFHTCAATGMQLTSLQVAADYRRQLTCWGWGDFGQLNPPPIDHVTAVAAGARHSCATDRARLVSCWGSNLYGQVDLPRPLFEQQNKYCRVGDYISEPRALEYGMCIDKVRQDTKKS